MKISHLLLALAVGLVGLGTHADAAVIKYETTLSGAAEDPPNASPGVGSAQLLIDTTAQTFLLTAEFSGLTGTTTAAHIHGPTANPGLGAAGVMTQNPYFLDFPIGVMSDSYAHLFDMGDASTFNPAFVTAQGGTVAGAEAAFLASLAEGRAYLNIHSTEFPGGEIRGFFAPAPIPLPAGSLLVLTGLAAFGALRLRARQT